LHTPAHARHSYSRAECLQIPLSIHGRSRTSEPLHPSAAQDLPLLPSGLRSLQVAGMNGTAPAAERLEGSFVAAPGTCCDTMSHIRDKNCCPLLCARLVSSHLGVLFLPGYFLKAK